MTQGIFKDNGRIYLVYCPKCGRENYAPNVASGICTWCGYDANKHAEELGFNNTKND